MNLPVYLNATYSFDSIAQVQQRFAGEVPGYVYAWVENPTQLVIKQRLASLENAEDLSADIMQALNHAIG